LPVPLKIMEIKTIVINKETNLYSTNLEVHKKEHQTQAAVWSIVTFSSTNVTPLTIDNTWWLQTQVNRHYFTQKYCLYLKCWRKNVRSNSLSTYKCLPTVVSLTWPVCAQAWKTKMVAYFQWRTLFKFTRKFKWLHIYKLWLRLRSVNVLDLTCDF
jgi:hypothetical protein